MEQQRREERDKGTMVLFDGAIDEDPLEDDLEEDEEEEVIEVDVQGASANLKNRWLAVALFYTNLTYSKAHLFKDMSIAWGLRTSAKVHDLEQDKFLIEFDSERTLNFVTTRGPWRHRGDALLIVPYNGMTQAADVTFESFPLWVRLFDLPEFMMNEDYGRFLAGRLGKVLEFGGAVRNVLRVRVDFALTTR